MTGHGRWRTESPSALTDRGQSVWTRERLSSWLLPLLRQGTACVLIKLFRRQTAYVSQLRRHPVGHRHPSPGPPGQSHLPRMKTPPALEVNTARHPWEETVGWQGDRSKGSARGCPRSSCICLEGGCGHPGPSKAPEQGVAGHCRARWS